MTRPSRRYTFAKGAFQNSLTALLYEDARLGTRIENVGDDADLQWVYGTERHLLYVAGARCAERDGGGAGE